MRFSLTAFYGVALLLAGFPCLAAQESVRLESGARARVISIALPANEQIVNIISAANDTIVFRPERNPVTRRLALSEISAIDISTGLRRKTARGALFGLAIGAGIGATLGYVTYESCNDWCMFTPMSPGGNAMLGATAGGLAGLIAGTAIGFLNKSETWHRVQPNTRIGVAPTLGGSGVSLSISF